MFAARLQTPLLLTLLLAALLLTLSSLGSAALPGWFGSEARLLAFFNTEQAHSHYFQNADSLLDFLLNADALYLPALYQDLMLHGGSLSQWSLPPAPYFFPDMALYFSLNALSGNTLSSVFLYGGVQLLLLAVTFACSYRPLLPAAQQAWHWATLSLLLILLALSSGYVPELISLVLSGYHGGAAVAAMGLLALILHWLKQPGSKVIPLLILLLLTLSTASDLLIVPQLTAPLLAALVLLTLLRQQSWLALVKQSAILLVATLLGQLLGKALTPTETLHSYVQIDLALLQLHGERLLTLGQLMASESPLYLLALLLTPLLAIAGACQGWKQQKAALLMASLFVLLSLASALLLALLFGKTAPRYLIPALLMPFWLLPIALARLTSPAQAPRLALGSMMVSGGMIVSVHGVAAPTLPTQYYPDDIACLDRYADRQQLKAGLADYWQEKRINLFSQQSLQMLQVTPELRLRNWINSRRHYGRDDVQFILDDGGQSSAYRLQPAATLQASGQTECGRWTISRYPAHQLSHWLQQDPAVLASLLQQPGQQVQIPAARLPSAIADSARGTSRISIQQRGHLSFGPYIPLTSGNYRFDFELDSLGSQADVQLSWDLVTPQGKTLAAGDWALPADTEQHKGTEFALPSDSAGQPLEIRLFHHGQGQVRSHKLVIQRLN